MPLPGTMGSVATTNHECWEICKYHGLEIVHKLAIEFLGHTAVYRRPNSSAHRLMLAPSSWTKGLLLSLIDYSTIISPVRLRYSLPELV